MGRSLQTKFWTNGPSRFERYVKKVGDIAEIVATTVTIIELVQKGVEYLVSPIGAIIAEGPTVRDRLLAVETLGELDQLKRDVEETADVQGVRRSQS